MWCGCFTLVTKVFLKVTALTGILIFKYSLKIKTFGFTRPRTESRVSHLLLSNNVAQDTQSLMEALVADFQH